MTGEEMDRMIQEQIEKIQDIRATKGREYATEGDTLADFKEVAAELGISPLQVWSAYVKKHLRAIDTFVREGRVKSEAIEDRVIDVVVYHLMLPGLIRDLDPAVDQPTQKMKLPYPAEAELTG